MDDYTVQVCNLSPKATGKDVKQFFSYAGTVKKKKLERAGQWAQVAFVTFKEPYALEIAVLLNGATIIDQKVCIVPWGGSEDAVIRWKKKTMKFQEEGNTQGASSFIPSAGEAVNVVKTMLSKGYTLGKDTLIKANELDKKYQVMVTSAAKVADFGNYFVEKSKPCSAGTVAVNSSYFASGDLMVYGAVDKADKAAAYWDYSKLAEVEARSSANIPC